MNYQFQISDRLHSISVEKDSEGWNIFRESDKIHVEAMFQEPGAFCIRMGNEAFSVHAAHDKNRIYLSVGGEQFILVRPKKKSRSAPVDADTVKIPSVKQPHNHTQLQEIFQ